MMELRLFPLETVLFPGMSLPLRVFEERYRRLVAECVEAGEPFGVALILEGEETGESAVPHSMGTTARIRSAVRARDGLLHLQTEGERRFRVLQLHHDRPYLWAEVEYPVDEATPVPEALLKGVRARHAALARLRMTAIGEYARDVRSPDAPGALADAVGAALQAPAAELQRLLETIDVRRRLERALELLEPAIAEAHREAAAAVAERYGSVAALN